VADSFDRLKTALADRYAIEYELGSGGRLDQRGVNGRSSALGG
jgi:hypothetical protein